MSIPMGRYWATVSIQGHQDKNATIGYDDPMETYFFQSGFEDKNTEEPIVWLGKSFREFASFQELENQMISLGVIIEEWKLEDHPIIKNHRIP